MAKATTNAPLVTELASAGTATITLNRPKVGNAFDGETVRRLTREVAGLDRDPTVRVIVLGAEGPSFCAGVDPAWLKRVAEFDRVENLEDAEGLALLLKTVSRTTKPTVAMVQGAAESTGVGLIAACDIVVASKRASFRLPDARSGLIAAPSAPYVVAAIGERAARRYMLTGEAFSADEARHRGLVHEVVAANRLKAATDTLVRELLQGGPRALAEIKNLVSYVADASTSDEKTLSDTAGHLARVRASQEGRDGLKAHLARRKPPWIRR